MNRYNIATYCVNKLNVPTLIFQAGDFAAREYEMIYDKHNWRDVEFRYADVIPANTQDIALNVNCSRVASIVCGGKVLDPVNAVEAMQIDPQIFNRTGAPTQYEEVVDPVTKNHLIRFYPQPVMDTPITVVGIRAIAQLGDDSAVSAIRNIDNVIIAYVEADLLQRTKQYGLAQQQRTVADALLATAIELDTNTRSNFPRETTNLSVSGGTLVEMVDAVCIRAKNFAPETRVTVREILRRNYVELVGMTNWREAQIIRLVSAVGGSSFTLPKEFENVMDVRQDSQTFSLLPADTNYFFNLDPQVLDLTTAGIPTHFVLLPNVATPVLLPSPEPIVFVSDSANDTSFVFLRGEANGVEQHETVKLTGTTPVSSTLSYDTPLVIGKEITTGNISITSGVSNTPMDIYPPDERARTYIRVQLYRQAGADLTLMVHGKRHVAPLTDDGDKPIIRDCQQALIYMTLAEALPLIGDDDTKPLAANYGTKAEKAIKDLMNRELSQMASKTRIVPIITDFNGRNFRTRRHTGSFNPI